MKKLEENENLDQILETHSAVMLQFGTAACAPCAAIKEKLDVWGGRHPEVLMRYISVEEYPHLAAQRSIFTAPTVCFYVLGKLTLQDSGYFSLDALLERAERYLSFL